MLVLYPWWTFWSLHSLKLNLSKMRELVVHIYSHIVPQPPSINSAAYVQLDRIVCMTSKIMPTLLHFWHPVLHDLTHPAVAYSFISETIHQNKQQFPITAPWVEPKQFSIQLFKSLIWKERQRRFCLIFVHFFFCRMSTETSQLLPSCMANWLRL